jgi:3-mercaptopyruvate sulfurtransferase SseA
MCMKRWSAALAAVCVAWMAAPAVAQTDPAAVPRVSVADTKKAVDAGTAVLLDVRDPVSFATGHLPGARLFTPADVAAQAAALKAAKKTVITYCA